MKNPLTLLLSCTILLLASSAGTAEQKRCQSINGGFGSLQGNLLQVPFAYQLELTLGTPVEEVLGEVETALVDQLLPYTFRECTDDDLIADAIAGVQSNISTEPVAGVACRGALNNPDNLCFVVRGHLNVFLAESQAAALVRQAISLDLHAVLDHHAVDHVTEDVVAVSFVDVNTLPSTSVVMKARDAAISWDLLVYMTLTAFVLAALALVWNRRMRPSDDYLPLHQDQHSTTDTES